MILPFSCCFGFFPNSRGLVNGILQTGFGIGGVIYNTLALKLTNPDNIIPTILSISGDKYFDFEVDYLHNAKKKNKKTKHNIT